MLAYKSDPFLPTFFAEQPLPGILIELLDSALARNVEATLDIVLRGGLITSDEVGTIRLQEFGASGLFDLAVLNDNTLLTDTEAAERQAVRLLSLSRLATSFSKIKGQKKALQLILRLLGLTGEIIEYDDQVRMTVGSTYVPVLEPGQVIVVGTAQSNVTEDLVALTGKPSEQILSELLDLFAWAHMRFAGVLFFEELPGDYLIQEGASLPVTCITQVLESHLCEAVVMPLHSVNPITNELVTLSEAGRQMGVMRYPSFQMMHMPAFGPYGCTDKDGSLLMQWNIGDPGVTVGELYSCNILDMPSLLSTVNLLQFQPCAPQAQWLIGGGSTVGSACGNMACLGSTVTLEVTP